MPDTVNTASKLLSLLGIEGLDRSPPSARLLEIREREEYSLEILSLDLNEKEAVPAYFLKPHNAKSRMPTVLYNHSHGGNYRRGKDELLIGAEYMQAEPYGKALTRLGFNVLCFDAWCFGDRGVRTESATFKRMLWHGEVLWGQMVRDALRAVDYLAARPDVDPERIGALGMSMGGTQSWWTAALEPRVSVCVDICSMTDYHTLDRLGSHDRHDMYYYVPGLLTQFSTADIVSLIAPRWHLSLNGESDALTPRDGFKLIDEAVSAAYSSAGHPERWALRTFAGAHFETAEMRAQALAFLKNHL